MRGKILLCARGELLGEESEPLVELLLRFTVTRHLCVFYCVKGIDVQPEDAQIEKRYGNNPTRERKSGFEVRHTWQFFAHVFESVDALGPVVRFDRRRVNAAATLPNQPTELAVVPQESTKKVSIEYLCRCGALEKRTATAAAAATTTTAATTTAAETTSLSLECRRKVPLLQKIRPEVVGENLNDSLADLAAEAGNVG